MLLPMQCLTLFTTITDLLARTEARAWHLFTTVIACFSAAPQTEKIDERNEILRLLNSFHQGIHHAQGIAVKKSFQLQQQPVQQKSKSDF